MSLACNQINPFLGEWDTPYGIPPFSEIEERDYIPAVKVGIKQQQIQIDHIIANNEEPTFENTVVAYEQSGAMLDKVSGVLFNLAETDGTPSLQRVVEKVIPMLSEHSDNIFMNHYFFLKVKELYDKKDSLGLDSEQMAVLDKLYRSFVNNGVGLDKKGRERMSEINKELASLEYKFGNNLLAENNEFAEEFGVTISEYSGFMASCPDRDLRERMFKAYTSRGANGGRNDNRNLLLQIMALREEKAALLGYSNPAEFILSDKMAGNPEAVDTFLGDIMSHALVKASEEVAQMQVFMDNDIKEGLLPEGSAIKPWDWAWYAEKVRKEKYALDENEIKPYFKMENVREGVFKTAQRLYGLKIEKLDSIPLYHPEVEGFKVTDEDGSLIGILLTDYFPRSSKRGGAWMNNVRNQEISANGEDIRPIIVNVGNFTKPVDGKPSLLTLDEVSTMFHEFGHALHGLLSKCRYKGISGTSVARDFVELPSQINENWAFSPEVLATYAFHYETGEPMPAELMEKIRNAGTFNQGFMTTELVAASILDMKWHELSSVYVPEDCEYASDKDAPGESSLKLVDPLKFEAYVCSQMGLIDEIVPRYRTTYFAHIFNSGYSAGYYSYLWAEVLDKDAFELFRQEGIFNKKVSMSFRKNILEKGGSEDPMELYRRFRGAEPDPKALLRARGLI